MRRLPHADGTADRARPPGARARSSRTCLSTQGGDGSGCIASPPTASPARSAIRSRPIDLGTRDSFNANFIRHAHARRWRARVIFGPYADRCRPQDDHAVGDRIRAGRGSAHPAVGAVRVVPHADHTGLWSRRRGDWLAARADELSGVAAQRVQQGAAQLPVVSHAGRGRSRSAPRRCSATRATRWRSTCSSAGTRSWSGCSTATGPSWASRHCRRSSKPPPKPRYGSCSRTRLASGCRRRELTGGTLRFDRRSPQSRPATSFRPGIRPGAPGCTSPCATGVGSVVFESGAIDDDGSIAGNDSDVDPTGLRTALPTHHAARRGADLRADPR